LLTFWDCVAQAGLGLWILLPSIWVSYLVLQTCSSLLPSVCGKGCHLHLFQENITCSILISCLSLACHTQ
jgi:hypothetical protein